MSHRHFTPYLDDLAFNMGWELDFTDDPADNVFDGDWCWILDKYEDGN